MPENAKITLYPSNDGKHTTVTTMKNAVQDDFNRSGDGDLESRGHDKAGSEDRRLPLTWQGLHYQVRTKNGVKVLLNDVNGVARDSEMFYVMGPSGAGKSTFLDALADRLSGTMRGLVLVDGKQLEPTLFKKLVKYVQAGACVCVLPCDVCFSSFCVVHFERRLHSARIRLPSTTL